MPVLDNPFEEPILPLDRTNPKANAALVEAVAGQMLGARQRALDDDRVGTPRPKHRTQAEMEAEARANVAAAKATREKAQPEVERATTEASLRADMASYQAKGLNEWAEEVETLITRWNELPQSERDYLIKKRKEGYLIIGIPSAQTQLRTIKQAIDKLIPTYTNPDTDKRELSNPTGSWWDPAQELINNHDPSLTLNTPNYPYFLVVEPSEGPPEDSFSKTVIEQIEWIAKQHAKDPHLFCTNLLEYITLQVRNTENGQEPTDQHTRTRFVDVSQRGGGVLCAYWNPKADDRQLVVGGDVVGALSDAGVRLSGRI